MISQLFRRSAATAEAADGFCGHPGRVGMAVDLAEVGREAVIKKCLNFRLFGLQ